MNIHLILLAISFIYTHAQDCSSPKATKGLFGSYLSCVKRSLDADYGGFESEVQEHYRQAASKCFSSSISEANKKDRCVLTLNDLNSKAWDRNGPLRDCSICRTFASGAIKAILNTPAEDQKCIRNEISKAIAKEANYCISKKISNFPGVPEIPDLEESSFFFKESVMNSISDFILVQSRLAFCGERKPKRAQNTRKCLKKPFDGFLSKHCQVIQNCDAQVPGSCLSQVKEVRDATCECVDEARNDLKQRISSISQAIQESISGGRSSPSIGSSSKVDVCVANIKAQMVTPANDWVNVIDAALGTCIKAKPTGQSLGMESLLNVGCRKVIADTTGTASSQLKTGFDFVNNLIDAMVERSGRFCNKGNC
uniref:Saposin B-type domain-containing protein n=1 Tax=Strongyloides papillosus TaxID=174720 RepID=A0A0N5B6E9_STREA